MTKRYDLTYDVWLDETLELAATVFDVFVDVIGLILFCILCIGVYSL